jgi:methylenetetrahydrofolate dehydrogenase (NADP+)/methenyltetrahydrofolate cyclohydrolase
MGVVLDGRAAAQEVRQQVRQEVERLSREGGVVPGLATVLIGDNPVSRVYVGSKEKACREVGIVSVGFRFPSTVSLSEVLALIASLNQRADIHGILVQLPLPAHLEEERVIEAIAPKKDVDGLHPYNQGRFLRGQQGLRPCTPLGAMCLLDKTGMDLEGKRAVVIGRSPLVGKPMALLLLERHATVTLCHSHTHDLAQEVKRAEILVSAAGRVGLVKGEWIQEGAAVIDVGISRLPDGSLKGDVEFAVAQERASFITPVPGGVGPMTVAMLLANTVKATKMQVSTQQHTLSPPLEGGG